MYKLQNKVFNHNVNQGSFTLVSTTSASITSLYYKNKHEICLFLKTECNFIIIFYQLFFSILHCDGFSTCASTGASIEVSTDVSTDVSTEVSTDVST